MVRNEIIEEITKELSPAFTKKEVDLIIERFFEVIKSCLLRNERVYIKGFGTFVNHYRKEKNSKLPKVEGVRKIPARYVPYFHPSKQLKEEIIKKVH
ncbi:MAG TPA: integration host factor subunit beta [bacterium (Candidatus Stahlbacteria)]|nr:integration host factor subunit beta [Candidatus Stahlbacteria bacterium]